MYRNRKLSQKTAKKLPHHFSYPLQLSFPPPKKKLTLSKCCFSSASFRPADPFGTSGCHRHDCSNNTRRFEKGQSMGTLQGINISHLGKRKIIFKTPFLGDMLVPWRVDFLGFSPKMGGNKCSTANGKWREKCVILIISKWRIHS